MHKQVNQTRAEFTRGDGTLAKKVRFKAGRDVGSLTVETGAKPKRRERQQREGETRTRRRRDEEKERVFGFNRQLSKSPSLRLLLQDVAPPAVTSSTPPPICFFLLIFALWGGVGG